MANAGELYVKVKADTSEAQKSISGMGGAFKAVLGALAAYEVGGFIKDMIKLSGQMDSVGTAFRNLAQNAKGGSDGLLAAVTAATQGTVSQLDIMRTSNLAMQLMGEQVIQYLPRMAEIASAAARASGQDVQKLFSDIVTASGRQSVLILDNLGISSATARNEMDKYAASLGKTREQLTASEKSQAFFNAVMVAGGELVNKVGSRTLTLGENLQRLQATSATLGQKFAANLAPALNDLLNAVLDSSTGSSILEDALGGVGKMATEVINTITMLTQSFKLMGIEEEIEANIAKRKMIQDLYFESKKKFGEQDYRTKGFRNDLDELQVAYDKLAEAQKKGIEFTSAYWDGTLEGAQSARKAVEGFQRVNIKAPEADVPKAGGGRSGGRDFGIDIAKGVDEQMQKIATINSSVQNVFSGLGDIASMYYNNQSLSIDNWLTKKLQSIQTAYDAEKAAILASSDTEKEKNEKLKALDEKRARDEKKASEKAEKEKRKIAYEAAKYQKAFMVTDTIMATNNAVIHALGAAPWGPWNYAYAATVAAIGAAKLALIAAQPLPKYAKGGIAETPGIIGEAGPEAAIPLTGNAGREALTALAGGMLDAIAARADDRATVSNSPVMSGGGDVYLDGALVGKWISRGSESGTFTINRRVIVN